MYLFINRYESSASGWNENEKLEELFDPKAYYIIAFDEESNDKPIGYCHFRFDMDYEDEVIYWYIFLKFYLSKKRIFFSNYYFQSYELQIELNSRKSGLGKFMMEFLETLCIK